MIIRTNNKPRFTIDAFELSEKEQQEFDYLDWPAIEAGKDSATFFRYKGNLYDLGEFMRIDDSTGGLTGWHGVCNGSAFHGTIIKFPDINMDSIIVGLYFC